MSDGFAGVVAFWAARHDCLGFASLQLVRVYQASLEEKLLAQVGSCRWTQKRLHINVSNEVSFQICGNCLRDSRDSVHCLQQCPSCTPCPVRKAQQLELILFFTGLRPHHSSP